MHSEEFCRVFPNWRIYSPCSVPASLEDIVALYRGDNLQPVVPTRILDCLGLSSEGASGYCKTIVVENEYVDRDYSRAYSEFYCTLHREIERTCTRLHFFANDLREVHFLDPSSDWKEYLQEGYLGFSVRHDVGSDIVGRTIIRPQGLLRGNGPSYVAGAARYGANVMGYHLRVLGVPFVQQDGRVAACASCALWTCLQALSRRFWRMPAIPPSDITQRATRFETPRQHSFLNAGLSAQQMERVLNDAGYDPLVLECPKSLQDVNRMLSAYLSSQIPVVLCLKILPDEHWRSGHHAVTATGIVYRPFDESPTPDSPVHSKVLTDDVRHRIYHSSQWIDSFLVHDDQSGPFVGMRLEPYSDSTYGTRVAARVIRHTSYDGEAPEYVALIDSIIVPLPQKVYLLDWRASARAIEYWLNMADTNEVAGSVPENTIMHTYLASATVFKDQLISPKLTGLPSDLAAFYRGRQSHPVLWVSEFGSLDDWAGRQLHQSPSVGEVLIDSTTTDDVRAFVAVHVPGFVAWMDKRDDDWGDCLTEKTLAIEEDYDHQLMWPHTTGLPFWMRF